MRLLGQGSQKGFRLLTPRSHEQLASAEALQPVDFNAYHLFIDDWLREVSVRLLVRGNHDEAAVFPFSDVVESPLLQDSTPVGWRTRNLRRIRTRELAKDLETDHLDSSFIVICECSKTTVGSLARDKLLGELIRRDLFTDIGAKQHIGYSFSHFRNGMDYVPEIQSSSAEPALLTEMGLVR